MTIPPPDPSPSAGPHSSSEPHSAHAHFAPEEFRARRVALRAACPDGLILIRGATEDEMAPGSASVYRQNSAFFYLTGVETPGALLVLLPDGVSASAGLRGCLPQVREILFLPARDPVGETWTGAKLGPGVETEQTTGIEKTADRSGLWGALSGWLRRNPVLFMLMPYGEQARLTREYALMQQIAAIAPVAQFRDCALALTSLRAVKSPAEIERIQQAIAITVEGQRAARRLIAGGADRWEYEVEAAIFEMFRRRGATLAFAPIVGAGVNGTVLHYEENHCQMRAGDMVVVDIGARYDHYCGDLTRTYPVGGVCSSRQREIYTLVLEAHRQAVAAYQPGVDSLVTLNERCKAFLNALPQRACDASGTEQTLDDFMPHRLGHHLGLDVHDVGDSEVPLLPGNIITIEPGIYISSEGFGVRLEDNYLVTASGLERLGPSLEIEPDDMLAAMRQG